MNGTDGVRLAPLLPVSALSLTWTDIALPGLLIALALLLHTVAYPQEPSSSDRAHIYRATTSHARFLPREAAGRFHYPVLYLGFDLHALESGGLDLGRLFNFRGRKRQRRWAVLTVNPRNYLGAAEPRERIYSRLVDLVAGHGVAREAMASAYTVAMPGLLGFEDINPLTTHFCYGAGRELIAVVLEVSNTFGEKHAYVLRVGVNEDAKPGRGFDHRWTFPRAFHVSPFNDRSGFYRVSVADPLQSGRPATLSIHIALLTSDRQKKLVATLEGVGEPFTDGGLIAALCRFPLELLLTTPRILYQAAKLHYKRRLDVYPRPEPHVDGGVAAAVNPVEGGGRAASVLWQDWAGGDARAVRLVGRSFEIACARHEQASGERVQVVFEAEDAARERIVIGPEPADRTLAFRYASPLVFTDLLMLPTADAALLIGSRTERRWRVDDEALFRQLWSGPPSGRIVDALRASHLRWSMSFAPSAVKSPVADGPRPRLGWADSVALVRETWSTVVSERLGYTIFGLTGARFVSGTEPWAAWARMGRDAGQALGGGFGSVLRA